MIELIIMLISWETGFLLGSLITWIVLGIFIKIKAKTHCLYCGQTKEMDTNK
jgi:hypothetical protein